MSFYIDLRVVDKLLLIYLIYYRVKVRLFYFLCCFITLYGYNVIFITLLNCSSIVRDGDDNIIDDIDDCCCRDW